MPVGLLDQLGGPLMRLLAVGEPDWIYMPAALNPVQVRGVPVPLDSDLSDVRTLSLMTGSSTERVADHVDLLRRMQQEPRTRVWTGLQLTGDPWYAVLAVQLARMTGYQVACSVYESGEKDSGLGEHLDTWFQLLVHLRGSKQWKLHHRAGGSEQLLMNRGDALIMQPYVEHEVSTPAEPGFSTHLAIGVHVTRPVAG